MKILPNTILFDEAKVLVENKSVRIDQYKIADDFSTTNITIQPDQEYSFTTRSGILSPMIGTCVVSNGQESIDVSRGVRVALQRNERITISNNSQVPLTVNILSAN
jgi:mannose-6-phosphate isomerase class I